MSLTRRRLMNLGLASAVAPVAAKLLGATAFAQDFGPSSGLLGKVDCPCCQKRDFEWLDGRQGSHTTTLCGRNAVQISPQQKSQLTLEQLAEKLQGTGAVTLNPWLLRLTVPDHELTVFRDGRAIIQGTEDLSTARTLYARYIGM